MTFFQRTHRTAPALANVMASSGVLPPGLMLNAASLSASGAPP